MGKKDPKDKKKKADDAADPSLSKVESDEPPGLWLNPKNSADPDDKKDDDANNADKKPDDKKEDKKPEDKKPDDKKPDDKKEEEKGEPPPKVERFRDDEL